jgi:hemoglobin-like flavoprotein
MMDQTLAEKPESSTNSTAMEAETLLLQQQNDHELIERRKQAVRSSWRAVRIGLKDQATNIFYTHLFEKYPSVRPLFKDDMDVQSKKLFQAVCLVVDGVDNLDTLIPILHALGKAHAGFGTVRAHYEAVTECFLWMLNSILAQTPNIAEVTDAWEWALTLIGGIMADGGDEAMEENRLRMLAEQNGVEEKVEY